MKKKAFTLTELLVVVVIIGVLAAVVLPKFRQVIESRKTTEAEGIMIAVRNEQEARCLLDKRYTKDPTQLASLPKNLGKNYTYTLSAMGLSAQEKNNKYTLRMKSYGDGGICCEGAGCAGLSKDYPDCSSYNVSMNTECAAVAIEKEPNPKIEPIVPPQVCTPGSKREIVHKCGIETGWKCNEDGSGWKNYEESCEYTEQEKTSCECDDTPAQTADCDDYCLAYYGSQKDAIEAGCLGQYETVGSFTIKRACVDGKWETPSNVTIDAFEPDFSKVCFERKEFTCAEWINKGKTCQYGRKDSGIDNNKVSGSQFGVSCCKQPVYQWKIDHKGNSAACHYYNPSASDPKSSSGLAFYGDCGCYVSYGNNSGGYEDYGPNNEVLSTHTSVVSPNRYASNCVNKNKYPEKQPNVFGRYSFQNNAAPSTLPSDFFNDPCDNGGSACIIIRYYTDQPKPGVDGQQVGHTYKCEVAGYQ